tara:strand:- start:63 stop:458 length:396 start_codon:yes stop_codon:yes gene_type:complete
MSNQSRSNEAHQSKERPARIPMSSGNKLHVPESLKKEGYQNYWQVDRPGVLEQMERAWWEKVKDDRGDSVTVPAGGGETLYLMRIEQKYYDEDIAKQQKMNIETTAKQAQKLGEDEYVPMGRQDVAEREII